MEVQVTIFLGVVNESVNCTQITKASIHFKVLKIQLNFTKTYAQIA